jgi:hypothetical protein
MTDQADGSWLHAWMDYLGRFEYRLRWYRGCGSHRSMPAGYVVSFQEKPWLWYEPNGMYGGSVREAKS